MKQHQQQLQAAVNNIISAHKTLQDLLDTGVRQMNEIQAMLGEQVDATAPVKTRTRTRKAAAPADTKKTARNEARKARRAERKAAAAKAERAEARKAKQQ